MNDNEVAEWNKLTWIQKKKFLVEERRKLNEYEEGTCGYKKREKKFDELFSRMKELDILFANGFHWRDHNEGKYPVVIWRDKNPDEIDDVPREWND